MRATISISEAKAIFPRIVHEWTFSEGGKGVPKFLAEALMPPRIISDPSEATKGDFLRWMGRGISLGVELDVEQREKLEKFIGEVVVEEGDLPAVRSFVKATDRQEAIFDGTHDATAGVLVVCWEKAFPPLPAPLNEWTWDALTQFFSIIHDTPTDVDFVRDRCRHYGLRRAGTTSVRAVYSRGKDLVLEG